MRSIVIAFAITLAAAPAFAGAPYTSEVDYFVYPPRGKPELCTLAFAIGYEDARQAEAMSGSTTGSLVFGQMGGKAFVGLKARAYVFSQATRNRQQRRLAPIAEGALATAWSPPTSARAVACEPQGAFCGSFTGDAASAVWHAIQKEDGATLLIRKADIRKPLAFRIGHRVDARNERAYENFQACMRAVKPAR